MHCGHYSRWPRMPLATAAPSARLGRRSSVQEAAKVGHPYSYSLHTWNQGATKSLPTICLFETCLKFHFFIIRISCTRTLFIYILYASGTLGPTISLNPPYIPLQMIDRVRGHGLHPQFKQLQVEIIIVHVSNIVQLLMNNSIIIEYDYRI